MRSAAQRSVGAAVIAAAFFSVLTLSAQQAPPAAPGGRGGGDPMRGQPRINALIISGGCCHDYPYQAKILIDTINKVAAGGLDDRDPGRPRHDW